MHERTLMKWHAYTIFIHMRVCTLNYWCATGILCENYFIHFVLSLYIKHFDYLIRYLNNNSCHPSSHSARARHRICHHRLIIVIVIVIIFLYELNEVLCLGRALKIIFHYYDLFWINWSQCWTSQISIRHTSWKWQLISFCWILF